MIQFLKLSFCHSSSSFLTIQASVVYRQGLEVVLIEKQKEVSFVEGKRKLNLAGLRLLSLQMPFATSARLRVLSRTLGKQRVESPLSWVTLKWRPSAKCGPVYHHTPTYYMSNRLKNK
jgi:hypothetical protein